MGYLGRDIGISADKSVNTDLRESLWLVYDEYELKCNADGDRYVARAGKGGLDIEAAQPVFAYLPLVNHMDLFLRFARLKPEVPSLGLSWSASLTGYPHIFDDYDYSKLDTDKNAETALGWARDNGVLGLASGSLPRRGGEPVKRSGGNPDGGPEEKVWRFVVESLIANRTLRLYEAATSPDPAGSVWTIEKELSGDHSPEHARRTALDDVSRTVETMLEGRCYPTLRRRKDGIVQGWGFESLLGAMWLQMMWLVSADGEVRRCKRGLCNRVVTIEMPDPDELTYKSTYRGEKEWLIPTKHKTHKNKQYCSDSCKTLAWREREREASA